MSLIAVFSGAYCGTEEIVQKVAERLNCSVVNEELLDQTAKEFGIDKDKLERATTGSRALLNSFTHEWEKSLIYITAKLAQLIKTDDQIYFGPATLLIPTDITHILRVEVITSDEERIKRLQQDKGMGAEEASKWIENNDHEIAEWTRQVLPKDESNESFFDIRISLPAKTIDEVVEIICENDAKEALKPTDASIQAQLDFQLAASLNVALAEKGQSSCSVRSENGNVSVVIDQSDAPAGALARTVRSLRYDGTEEEVQEIASNHPGVKSVEIRPGVVRPRRSKTLLVDDEREYVMTLSERLEMRDIPADIAYDGEQALTFVKTDVPDVMVLDLRMPGIDGLEVLRRIKNDHPHVQVIIVTGHGSEKDEQAARDLGAFEYLKKPVDINILSEKIKEAEEASRRSAAASEDSD